MSIFDTDREGYRKVYIRVINCEMRHFAKLQAELREKAIILYIADQRE